MAREECHELGPCSLNGKHKQSYLENVFGLLDHACLTMAALSPTDCCHHASWEDAFMGHFSLNRNCWPAEGPGPNKGVKSQQNQNTYNPVCGLAFGFFCCSCSIFLISSSDIDWYYKATANCKCFLLFEFLLVTEFQA